MSEIEMQEAGFSCYLIGGDTLLMECGDVLLERGHDIRGVVTANPRIARWCAEQGIESIDTSPDYKARMAEEAFDYLFAITHLAIIPDDVLELPAKLSVNFHDGPLPRYAGLNTPVWALMNREPTYGISWHVIDSGVDRGDLLKQSFFDVAPDDTALSLNTKCMVAALDTFPELVDELARGEEQRTVQDTTDRSYFGKFTRPDAACLIDWSRPAADVDAFVRALTFGPYDNPMGLPKTAVAGDGSRPFVVTAVDVGSADVGGEAGTILEVSDGHIVVAAGEGSVAITALATVEGDTLTAMEAATRFGLKPGTTLLPADSETAVRLTEADAELCRAEGFWIKRLAALEPAEVALGRAATGAKSEWQDVDVEVPGSVADAFGERAPLAVLSALAVHLARTGRKEHFHLAFSDPEATGIADILESWYARSVPFAVDLDPTASATDALDGLSEEWDRVRAKRTYLSDSVLRRPDLGGQPPLPVGVSIGSSPAAGEGPGSVLSLTIAGDGRSASLSFDASRLDPAAARSVSESLTTCLAALAGDPSRPWTELDLVAAGQRHAQLVDWNATEAEYADDLCVHELFERQVDATPDAVALVFEGEALTYRELDERANQLAHHLIDAGVGPDAFVGANVGRSLDLMVTTLGIMKAGGAYVPLDPDFPADRLAFMIEDSQAGVLVTQADLEGHLPSHSAKVVRVDADWPAIAAHSAERPASGVGPENLAYAIYTSGSTGKPKGVLVEHHNVSNFFTGMDAVIQHDPPGVWLAVTSLSFDISVLELFWTLARGFKVVVYEDRRGVEGGPGQARDPRLAATGIDFGLFMWGNDDGPGPRKYRLMLEGAKFFDENGFNSVWTPERHFHAFGGPFPNPSVTGAALAAVTENLSIRSGSCVSPLHHSVRIAEEWAVVDNLSNGRVGLSFAAGWQPNDFVLRPESYPNQKQVMIEQIDVVRRLWRGEQVEFENPRGEMVPVTTLPRPVQPELPFWITTAGNPETYRTAGRMGANVLTHLLGQSLEEVAGKIVAYREARAEVGLDPAAGNVTLMLHTFVGTDNDEVRELVRQPMKDYLGASMKLVLGFAWTFPAFKRPGGAESSPDDVDLSSLSDEEVDAILDFAFDRYYETSGLFGDVDTCVAMVDSCKAIGVDEIACLIDFGVDTDLAMSSLPYLKQVRDASNSSGAPADAGAEHVPFERQVRDNGVTHMQCTPSMARMLVGEDAARNALGDIAHLMVGGEAFPPALAAELRAATDATITNMYGPTETTIWSSTHRVEGAPEDISIGRPIANTKMYVLDRYKQPLPLGVAGDLYIGGAGVTRGYHERPDITAERFSPDPFAGGDARMYWTGDLARFAPDGTLDFLGRTDHQVKIRGYRIELGEIEARLGMHDGVTVTTVVLAEMQPGDQRLVAYVVPAGAMPTEAELKSHLRADLPEYMLPSHFIELDRMPLTPNGKIDRAQLPSVDQVAKATVEYVEPSSDVERTIAASWCRTLGVERVGVEDNFFDIGGHSLLVVQLHRELTGSIEQTVSLVDLYRFPTIRSLTDHLSSAGNGEELKQSADRAAKRKQAMGRRRSRKG